MTLVIVFTALAAVIVWLLMSSIRLRFSFDDSEKLVAASYTLLCVRIDFEATRGHVTVGMLPVFRFRLKRKPKPEKPKRKRRLKFKLKWSDFKIDYLYQFKSCLSKIRIKYLDIKITGGFKSPYRTGQACALYWAAVGILPRLMKHISFNPDFDAEKIDFSGKGLVSLRLFYIIRLVYRLLADRIKNRIQVWFTFRRKGESYG